MLNKIKISLLCFDLSDNSFGRAALLAKALSKNYSVELLGPAKDNKLWLPLRNIDLPVKLFPWNRFPNFSCVVRDMIDSIEGDVLFACKPRFSSFGVGLLAANNKPLLLDIDDWELGFFYRAGFWGRIGRFLNFTNPNGLPCTWMMEQLVSRADGITVSNRFLQGRFGGELVYHCRDTKTLDPTLYKSEKIRCELGLERKKILMFLGTPREHKGIDDLYKMIKRIRNPLAHLVIVGVGVNENNQCKFSGINGKVTLLPPISFNKLGDYLAAADCVVIPQRETSDTVGQIPAKIFDAMAMGKPVVSTRVSDIPEILGENGYLVEPENPYQLAETVDSILENIDEAYARGIKLRDRCQALFDITIMERKLDALVKRTILKNKSKKSKINKI